MRERLIHHVHDLFALEQLAILLNGEIAVKFTQNVLRVGGWLHAHMHLAVHRVQHLAAFKLYRRVNALVHQIRQRAFRAAKTGVHHVTAVAGNGLGQIHGRRVKLAGVPKAARPARGSPNGLKHVAPVKRRFEMSQLFQNVLRGVVAVIVALIVRPVVVQIIVRVVADQRVIGSGSGVVCNHRVHLQLV